MRFKTLAFFELVANISSPIAVIAAIFFLPQEAKYFALPAGFAFSSALYAVAVFSREKPVKPKLDVPETKRLLFFGSKVMLVELLAVFLVYGINLFVGKFFSIFELGLFSIAFTIANAPIELVSSSLFRVTYAGLSKEKSNKKNFSKIYEKISLKTLFILFPILSWLFVFAKPFNEIILKKDPMLTQLILAFCLFSFFRSMQKNCTSLFAGAGKPGMSLKLSVAETIVLAAIIFPLMQAFGFVGVVLALAGARMVSMIVAIVLSGNFVENSRAINASIAKSTASLLPIPVLFLILNSAIVFGMAGFLFLSAGFFLLFSAQYAIFGQLKKILE
jgi:O-antigen/teichoic acid export membrane protein